MTCLSKRKIEEKNKGKIATLDTFYDKFKTDRDCEDFLEEVVPRNVSRCP